MTWIDPRIWLLVVAGVIAGAACGYLKGHRDADQSAKVADQAKQIADLTTERREIRRQLAAQQEIATDAAKERDQARRDAAAADGATDSLRKQVATLVADVRRAGVPALRPEARQPATSSICSPTCSAGLTKLRESWQRSLTNAASPAGNASAVMTR